MVEVEGEVDICAAPELKTAFFQAIDAGATRLIVDFCNVSFIDSIGLGILVSAANRLRQHDAALEIVGPRPEIQRIFEVTALDHVLVAYPTREAALRQ